MKIAITGHMGQIGSRLVKLGAEPLYCDITNRVEVEREIDRVSPDVVLHLAAATSVDLCQKDYGHAITVNVFGTNTVCEAADKIIGAGKVALISTDQIFDGRKGNYKEGDEGNPINSYGWSKFGAEAVAHLYDDKIVRISRCFDSKSEDISSYIERVKSGMMVSVPDFLYRSYCHLDFMARSLFLYAQDFKTMPNIFHIAGATSCSFWNLIAEIAHRQGLDAGLVVARGEKEGFTPRPHKAGLSTALAQSLAFPIYTIESSIEKLNYENL